MRAQRNHPRAIVTLDVEKTQILGSRAVVIRHFENDLVLIRRLFDQVAVVLGIRVVQKIQNAGFRDAVDLCLVAQNFKLQVRRMVKKIRVDEQKAGKFLHLGHQFVRRIRKPRRDPRRKSRKKIALAMWRRRPC